MMKNTRKQIIDATLSLFATQPLEPVTMDRIAKVVGISKPAIYRHFSNKEELLKTIDLTVTNDFSALFDNLDPARLQDTPYLLETFTKAILQQKCHFAFISHLMITRNIEVSPFLRQLFVSPDNLDSESRFMYRSALYSFLISSDIRKNQLSEKDVETFVEKIRLWYSTGLNLPVGIVDRIWQETLVGEEEIKEDRFLVALDNVVGNYGLNGLTIQRIAKDLNLASSTLYYSFPTKEALVHETARREFLQFQAILDRKLEKATDVGQALQILFSASSSYVCQRPRLAVQFIALSCFLDNGIPSQFTFLAYWIGKVSTLQEKAGNLGLFLAIAPQFKQFGKATDPLECMNYTKLLFRFFTSGSATEEL
jgi:AcrR family transcriptional regulator